MKKKRKEHKRKNRGYLLGVIKNAEEEIGVWTERVEAGLVSGLGLKNVENRICVLMNQTLPNAQDLLEALNSKI